MSEIPGLSPDFDIKAVDFDWKNWRPKPGGKVRFLTEGEFKCRYTSLGAWFRSPMSPSFTAEMRHLCGAEATVGSIDLLGRVILIDIQVNPRRTWHYHKYMIVPLSVRTTFREFVKNTKDALEGVHDEQ